MLLPLSKLLDLPLEALPVPRGVLTRPLQLCAPPLVRIAIATKQPIKQMSRRIAKKAKNVMPPKKQVRMTAKIPYNAAAPDMPSTALIHVATDRLCLASSARKNEKMPRMSMDAHSWTARIRVEVSRRNMPPIAISKV